MSNLNVIKLRTSIFEIQIPCNLIENNKHMKHSIAIYLQHYLAPSMTFIYRQLKSAEEIFNPVVFCSDQMENLERFPYHEIYFKKRNFLKIKKSFIFRKFYSDHKLLSASPKLSSQQIKTFSNIIKKKNVSLIHAHFGPSGLEIVDLAKDIGIPLLVTFHGYDASILLKMKKYKRNIQKLFNYAWIITVSRKMKDDLVNVGANAKRVSVIRCGIPVEFFDYVKREPINEKFSENKEIKFLQVSSFVEKKGHKYTIEAFRNFLIKKPNAKLTFAGDGYLRSSIQKLCQDFGISDKVNFLGLVNSKHVSELMREADIFLHHSVTSKHGDMEGVPTVIMEAMAMGLPVISTYHAGIPELINNNVNGYLVNERDINAYTNTILELNNCMEEIGLNARRKVVEDFNLKSESHKLFKLYYSLLNNTIVTE